MNTSSGEHNGLLEASRAARVEDESMLHARVKKMVQLDLHCMLQVNTIHDEAIFSTSGRHFICTRSWIGFHWSGTSGMKKGLTRVSHDRTLTEIEALPSLGRAKARRIHERSAGVRATATGASTVAAPILSLDVCT